MMSYFEKGKAYLAKIALQSLNFDFATISVRHDSSKKTNHLHKCIHNELIPFGHMVITLMVFFLKLLL